MTVVEKNAPAAMYAPASIALAPMIALNDAGAPHWLRRVDFAADAQKGAAYRTLRPITM